MSIAGNATDSLAAIIHHVEAAGDMAWERQRAMDSSDRAYKADNSVVTEADKDVEDFLVEQITAIYPTANVITEETQRPFDPERTPTFAIDPIDGTDVYSQGMPGWCVSVGLLDGSLTPIGGVIFAPRLDLLIVADEDTATLNGSPLPQPLPHQPISVRSNLMVTSRIHKRLDLSGYIGKIRGIGSAALHLCYHLIYPAVIGALEGPSIRIWDIAAAHAINRAEGEELRYLNAEPLDYAPLVDGGPGADVVVAGREPIFKALREALKRLPPESRPGR